MIAAKFLIVATLLSCVNWTAFSLPFKKPGGRIIGGDKAELGQFPFIVTINLNDESTFNGHYCGGSIISNKWVVTAAHCFDGYSPLFYVVESDTISLNTTGTVHKISSVIVHQDYNDTIYVNDIALVQIEDEFTWSDTASVIEIGEADANETCTVIGWGSTETDLIPTELAYTNLTALSDDDCSRLAEGGMFNFERGPGQICAFGGVGVSPCYGDSGGPLVCHKKLIGIVSYAIYPCAAGFPDVYTKTAYYVDWINEVTGGIM